MGVYVNAMQNYWIKTQIQSNGYIDFQRALLNLPSSVASVLGTINTNNINKPGGPAIVSAEEQ